jgi:hypothetical protein
VIPKVNHHTLHSLKGSNNFTKVIVEELQKNGGVLEKDMAFKLLSFDTNGINVFQV